MVLLLRFGCLILWHVDVGDVSAEESAFGASDDVHFGEKGRLTVTKKVIII